MPTYRVTENIAAPAARAWAPLRNVLAWPEWLPTVTSVTPLGVSNLEIGARFRVLQPKLRPAIWRSCPSAKARASSGRPDRPPSPCAPVMSLNRRVRKPASLPSSSASPACCRHSPACSPDRSRDAISPPKPLRSRPWPKLRPPHRDAEQRTQMTSTYYSIFPAGCGLLIALRGRDARAQRALRRAMKKLLKGKDAP